MLSNAECLDYFGLQKSELVPGLNYIPCALSLTECNQLLSNIKTNKWFSNGNQMMFFGNLPHWLSLLYDLGIKMLPSIKRVPLFNQCIANYYEKSEGINSHIDLLKFDDGILIVSLLGTCCMEFKKNQEIVTFFLRPGDAISLSGEARYEWEHGIPYGPVDCDEEGRYVERGCRVSITLRSLIQDDDDCD